MSNGVNVTTKSFSNRPGILAAPDHHVAIPQGFTTTDATIVTVDSVLKIIKSGTIWPANDATAVGIVMNDVDVTNGPWTGALIIHGFIKTAALPAAPSTAAKAALGMIHFN